MDKFCNNYFLGGWWTLFNFTKCFEYVVGIIKIAESSEANSPGRKYGSASQQVDLSQNKSQDKEHKKFRTLYQHKWQAKGTTPNKGDTLGGNPPNMGHKESGFVVPRQIMFVPRMKC